MRFNWRDCYFFLAGAGVMLGYYTLRLTYSTFIVPTKEFGDILCYWPR